MCTHVACQVVEVVGTAFTNFQSYINLFLSIEDN